MSITVSTLGMPEQYVYPIILDMQIAMREHSLSPEEALALSAQLKSAAERVIEHKKMLELSHTKVVVYYNDDKAGEWECSCGNDWPCTYAAIEVAR